MACDTVADVGWDVVDARLVATGVGTVSVDLGQVEPVGDIAFSPVANLVAVGGLDGAVPWSTPTPGPIAIAGDHTDLRHGLRHAQPRPEGKPPLLFVADREAGRLS